MSTKKVVKKTTDKDLSKELTGNDVQLVVEGNMGVKLAAGSRAAKNVKLAAGTFFCCASFLRW